MLAEFHNLALGDTSDLVQMQAALTFHGLGSFRGTMERVSDHGYRDYRGSGHGQKNIQIKEYKVQRSDSDSKKILADICMGTCAAVSNRQTVTISLTARDTPRSVVYRNHQGCEFTHEEHAPDYATHVSDNF